MSLYRRQALGIGLVSLGFAYFTFSFDGAFNYLPAELTNGIVGNLQFVLNFYALLPLFYWTDVSVMVARESDPLERDHFHWSRVRMVLWPAILIALLVNTLAGLFVTANPSPSLSISFIVEFALLLIPIIVPLAMAAILLPLTALKSRDFILRKQLKWFALAAVSFAMAFLSLVLIGIVLFLLGNGYLSLNQYAFNLILYVFFTLSGYCLYRSARSIVPVYTFDRS